MNEQIFDAMLRTALEEALEEDSRERARQTAPVRQSFRQRRRMRQMLADPWRYERRSRAESQMRAAEREARASGHVHWWVLAAAVVLLTGTAAGYALRGGAFFQNLFEKSCWAGAYAGAADTQQVLDMGGTGVGTVVEDEQFRLELLDAISEGETAMAAVRITVKDTALLKEAFGSETMGSARFLKVEGELF